jgi:PAS domain S-box-containing protein
MMEKSSPDQPQDIAQRIAALVYTVRQAEEELRKLTGSTTAAAVAASSNEGSLLLPKDQGNLRSIGELTRQQSAETQIMILNSLPAHIAVLDPQGIILVVNESWRRFASANVLQSTDFFVGQNYLDVCENAHGDCAEEALSAADGIRRVLRGETQEFGLEYPCHSPTEKRWFRMMVTPVSENQLTGVVVIHVNVTERRLAEEALRENQERLEIQARRLNESQMVARVGSWETDLSTFGVIWTEQTHRIFETSPDHFLPSHQGFLDRIHPDDRVAVDAAFIQSIGQPGPFAIEHRLLLPNGRIKIVEERWRIFHDAAGKPVRAFGTCQDITERRLAADSLAQNQTLLRIAGKTARLGGWSVELPDYKLRWSDEICMIHEVPPGKTPTLEQAIHFYPPEYRDQVARHVKLCAEEGTPFDFELEIITATQRRVWVRAIGEAVRDERGQISRIQGAFQDISQQKAADEAARTAGSRLLDTLESISDGFFTVDREWRFTYVNAESERLLNCHRSTLLGRTLWEAYPPIVGTRFEEQYRRAVAENTTITFEEYYTPFDMWVEVRVYPSADGLAIYFRDVTERRRTREALRASESKFRQLADSNVLGIFSWDASGNISDANDAFLQMFGYTREELQTGQIQWRQMTPPEFLAADERGLAEIAATGSCMPFEKEYFHKDGHRVAIMVGAAALDGSKDHGICYVVDISQQKQAEAKVRASEASLIHAQQIARMGNWDWNIGTNEVYWSAQVFHLFGRESNDSLGTYDKFLESVHPADREHTHHAVQMALAGTAPYQIEHRVLWPDGTVRTMHEQGEVIRDADGRALKMTGTVQDITERKLTETALAEKTRALQLLSRCNKALIRSESELDLLADICQTAVDVGGFRLAWVGYALDDADKTILPRAHAGVEDGYLSKTTISWAESTPTGHGPAGKVIRSGEPVVIPYLAGDESFQPWVAAANERGFRGVIALPLKDSARTFGVLILYMPEVRHPLPDELHVLQDLADDMAFGIVNIRARGDRQRLQNALVNVAAGVSTTTGRQFFERLARNMGQALGAQASFVAQFLPDAPLRARTIVAVVDDQLTDNFEYFIEGTPCENLITSDTCMISSDVAQQFPRSPSLSALGAQGYVGRRLDSSTGKLLGLLFVLFRAPLQEPDFVAAMLQIFAARAAAELERQETDVRVREQAALLDKARDAILVRDLDHKILYWNQSAERLYGWSAAEAVGRSARELIYRDTAPLDAVFKKLMISGEWVGEMNQVTKDGRPLTVEGHWSLVRDELGNPQSVLAINTDVTERKKIEAQYLRSQRMESIGTLAGGIAHDLNNVLAPIMMSIELLKMQEKDARRISILTTIEGSARRGADMVQQVLSFARGVEGQQLEVQVGHLLKEIQKIVQDTFLKNIEGRSNIPSDLWLVHGDPTQLHQVLLNLCVNARDAMPNGGTLSLAASNLMLDEHYAGMNIEATPGSHVRIVVEDSGTGMPPDVIERIFEPFFTTKELGKGTGLGLSTTIAIVKSHGGFVRVYSEVGMGTRFHIYLPAHTEPGAQAVDGAPVELPRGSGELVLVIDDEAAVRQITRQTLEAFGYRVLLASDGIEATSIYATRKQEIAVILTDMMMPLMDGPTTIQVMLRLNPHARIIAASGLNANSMVAKAVSAGVKFFIPKPYTAETLLKTLREVVGDQHLAAGA